MTKPNKYTVYPDRPEKLHIPLRSHKAILAALYVAAMVGNDNMVTVRVKGYDNDWKNFTAIYLDDYADVGSELYDDKSFFAEYSSPELWITIPEGGAA